MASVAADNTAQLRRSARDGLTLTSRETANFLRSLEARPASIKIDQRTAVSKSQQDKRDGDDDPRPHFDTNPMFDKEEHDDHDGPDREEEEHRTNGKVVAGGVIGGLLALLLVLTIWYFLRIRPKRQQRLAAARKRDEIEQGYAMSPSPSRSVPPPDEPAAGSQSPSELSRWAPTPYPRNVPSVQTGSTMSGLALPTPALTHSSPSIATESTPPLPPSQPHAHAANDKPPAYAVAVALQSAEPQPEASSYQMGQTPSPSDLPPVYHVQDTAQPSIIDMKGEHMSRY